MAKPVRQDIPVWIAAIGPKNVELAAEVADGWQPIHFVPDRFQQVWGDALQAGAAKRSRELGAAADHGRRHRRARRRAPRSSEAREATRANVGFYVGGMGAREKNFYNELFQRYGWVDEAKEIQDLFLSGHREEAIAKVPDEYVDLATLAGDPGYVRDRIGAYRGHRRHVPEHQRRSARTRSRSSSRSRPGPSNPRLAGSRRGGRVEGGADVSRRGRASPDWPRCRHTKASVAGVVTSRMTALWRSAASIAIDSARTATPSPRRREVEHGVGCTGLEG